MAPMRVHFGQSFDVGATYYTLAAARAAYRGNRATGRILRPGLCGRASPSASNPVISRVLPYHNL